MQDYEELNCLLDNLIHRPMHCISIGDAVAAFMCILYVPPPPAFPCAPSSPCSQPNRRDPALTRPESDKRLTSYVLYKGIDRSFMFRKKKKKKKGGGQIRGERSEGNLKGSAV